MEPGEARRSLPAVGSVAALLCRDPEVRGHHLLCLQLEVRPTPGSSTLHPLPVRLDPAIAVRVLAAGSGMARLSLAHSTFYRRVLKLGKGNSSGET